MDKKLVGKTITGLYLSEDDELLSFITSDNKVMQYATMNDCCNVVWFNHISGYECLIGATVAEVTARGWSDVDDTTDYVKGDDAEDQGFWTIKTNKGYFDIEVRNSHNGYYGGSVCYAGSKTKGDLLTELLDKKDTPREILLDF